MSIEETLATKHVLNDGEVGFRVLADAMPQIVWSTLPDGFHDYYNQRWYAFTGMADGSTDGDTGSTPTPTPAPTTPAAPAQDVQAALAAAGQALQDREAAYAANDLVAAAQADQRLTEALARAIELGGAEQ